MAQLTANAPRVYAEETRTDWYDHLADAVDLFIGSAAGVNSANGCVRQLVAADDFAGFVEHQVRNANPVNAQGAAFEGSTPGTGVAAGTRVNCRTEGAVIINVVVGAGQEIANTNADKDKAVYASDGNTFTSTAAGNTKIGTIADYLGQVSGVAGAVGAVGQYLVYFQATAKRNS